MSNIWVPKVKILEPKDPIQPVTGLEGFYRLRVYRPDDRCRLDTGWFPNLITDRGLDLVGITSAYLGQCRVGTSNTAPNVTDTALVAQVGTSSSIQSNVQTAQASAPYYGKCVITYRFTPGTATGNLAEIGVGVGGGDLFSRALILDGVGSPTTITVLADEYLDASYELRIKPPLSDVVSSLNIDGTVYDTLTRAANVTAANHWAAPAEGGGTGLTNITLHTGNIAAITSVPSNQYWFNSAPSTGTYTLGTYFRDMTASYGLDAANNTLRTVMYRLGAFAAMGAMQTQLDNGGVGLPKNNTQIMTLNFRHIWARGTP